MAPVALAPATVSVGASDTSSADLPGAVDVSAMAEVEMSEEDFVVSQSDVKSDALVSMDEVASEDEEVVRAALRSSPPRSPRRQRKRRRRAVFSTPPLEPVDMTFLLGRVLTTDSLRPSVKCGTIHFPGRRSALGISVVRLLFPRKNCLLLLFFFPPPLLLLCLNLYLRQPLHRLLCTPMVPLSPQRGPYSTLSVRCVSPCGYPYRGGLAQGL